MLLNLMVRGNGNFTAWSTLSVSRSLRAAVVQQRNPGTPTY
jgi:hypothetical protein